MKKYAGRRFVFWGGALLALEAGLDVSARLETLIWAIKGLMNLCANEGIPFARAISYFDPGIFERLAFLVGCVLLGIAAFALRNRPRAGYGLFFAAVALCAYGAVRTGLFDLGLMGWARALEWLPLASICAGCVINAVQYHADRRKTRRAEREEQLKLAEREDQKRFAAYSKVG